MVDVFDELRDYCKSIKNGSIKPTIKIKDRKAVKAILTKGEEELIFITQKKRLDKAI